MGHKNLCARHEPAQAERTPGASAWLGRSNVSGLASPPKLRWMRGGWRVSLFLFLPLSLSLSLTPSSSDLGGRLIYRAKNCALTFLAKTAGSYGISGITDPSTNITKNILEEKTPFKFGEEVKINKKKTSNEREDVNGSAGTLKLISSLSSHSSLKRSQGFDSKQVLQNLKEKYKAIDNKEVPSSEDRKSVV